MSSRPPFLAGLPLDHVGIAVADLEAATEPYRLLGLPQEGEDEIVAEQRVKVRLLRAGDGAIELLQPTAPDSPVARFLQRRGPGLHHVALRVLALSAQIERLGESGARFVEPRIGTGRGGSRVAFLHPSCTGGVLVELVEHAH